MATYEHRTAYRHANNEVEGFIGHGGTKKAALADAVEQIKKKIDILGYMDVAAAGFDKARIVESPSWLATAEIEAVQKDWRSGTRY